MCVSDHRRGCARSVASSSSSLWSSACRRGASRRRSSAKTATGSAITSISTCSASCCGRRVVVAAAALQQMHRRAQRRSPMAYGAASACADYCTHRPGSSPTHSSSSSTTGKTASGCHLDTWARSDMRQLAYALHEGGSAAARSGTPDFFLWWNHTHLRALLPHIRETIRAELASLPSTVPARRVGEQKSTEVVVHFRAGDFTRETRWKPSQLRLCVASMVAAAQTFPDAHLISSFHILGGGIDHGCDPTVDDCGASALALVARGLRVAFPNATTRLSRGGSVDEDFIRMVYAPKLLLGSYGTELKVGSSFAVYAAAVSAGHVRSPGCFLRFDTCMPTNGGVMAMTPDARWQGYSHPSCKRCRKSTRRCVVATHCRTQGPLGCRLRPDHASVHVGLECFQYPVWRAVYT